MTQRVAVALSLRRVDVRVSVGVPSTFRAMSRACASAMADVRAIVRERATLRVSGVGGRNVIAGDVVIARGVGIGVVAARVDGVAIALVFAAPSDREFVSPCAV